MSTNTNSIEDKINDYINAHPRETFWFIAFGLMLIWQTFPALIAIVCYVALFRLLKINQWLILVLVILLMLEAIYLSQSHLSYQAGIVFFKQGFKHNKIIWHFLWDNQPWKAVQYSIHYASIYLVGSPLLMASILSLIDLISNNPHEEAMRSLQKGLYNPTQKEWNPKKISKRLANIQDENHKGTVLGVSQWTGKPLIIPDRHINQIALVLGTTGSGKTMTLRRFYQRALFKNYPLIIIDGKPDEANIQWLMQVAKHYDRPFLGFNCGNHLPYDALKNGNFTELKDKIICLKDQWENDYYRSIAEDYLQTTLEVLLKVGGHLDLKSVVECLNYTKLKSEAVKTNDALLNDRVKELKNYERKDITGLQAHLNILINSELGQYFNQSEHAFSLTLSLIKMLLFILPYRHYDSLVLQKY